MLFSIFYHPLFTDFASISMLMFLGYKLRSTNFIKKNEVTFLNNLILSIILPCFIISSFMKDLEPKFLTSGINIVLWAILIHIIFFLGAHYFYKYQTKLQENDKILLSNILPIGNISFFGLAILSVLYDSNGVFVVNMYSIINRVFINTFCLTSMSGLALERKNIMQIIKNPALLTSFICVFIFFAQDFTPQITINDRTASIFRIDHSIPFLFNSINKVGSMLSTFIWIIVGATITKESLATMLRSKYALIFAFQKTIVLPIIGIAIYTLLHRYTGFTIDNAFLPATLILLVTPVGNTLLIFSIKYERSPNLCLACVLTSTFFSLLLFPLYALFFDKIFPIYFL